MEENSSAQIIERLAKQDVDVAEAAALSRSSRTDTTLAGSNFSNQKKSAPTMTLSTPKVSYYT